MARQRFWLATPRIAKRSSLVGKVTGGGLGKPTRDAGRPQISKRSSLIGHLTRGGLGKTIYEMA